MPPQLPASYASEISTVPGAAIPAAEGKEARGPARVGGGMPIVFHGQAGLRSFALILALFAMAIMSILILTFIFLSTVNRVSSFSSSGQTRAGILALSALNFIEGDCIAEMQNGSRILVDPNSGVAVYWPTTNFTMVPYRMPGLLSSSNGVPANLVKWSSGTYPFWTNAAYYTTNGPIRACAGVSTTNASLNWHYVNSTLWTKPDFSTTNFPTTILPEWVLMTRQGPYTNAANVNSTNTSLIATFANSAATNANYVIGRYAYVVYDEGGLLDVAAAGFPSNVFSGDPTDVGLKGSQGFADLGPSGLGLTAAQATSFVNWRNAGTGTSTNTYLSYLTNYAPEFGFLQASTNGDQAFVSRQDLIQYWINELGAPANLLPYVTTFSREANAPGWGPEHDASDPTSTNYWNGSNTDTPYDGILPGTTATPITENDSPAISYAYHSNANNTSSYNRFFPNVRVKTAFTRLSGETALVGEPLVKNRFDLTKLSWITYNNSPPSGITTNDIYNYFGLTRNSDGSWTYNHGQSTAIMTLDQVATAGREPDFFELLQAAILRGGLGLCSGYPPGASTAYNGAGGEFYRVYCAANFTQPGYAFDDGGVLVRTDSGGYVVNAQSMYQVIQIGANLIDQYSSDNFPTEIVLNNQHFYGVKNLPYINGIGDAALRLSPTAAASLTGNSTNITSSAAYQAYVHRWLTFALWNPHQNAAYPPSTGPTTFRICAWGGEEYPYVQTAKPVPLPVPGYNYSASEPSSTNLGFKFEPATNGPITPNDPAPGFTDGPAWIGFYMTNYPNNFSDPTAINYSYSFTHDANNPVSGNMNDPDGRISTPLGYQRAGIYLGWSWSPDNPYKVPLCSGIYTNYSSSSFTTLPVENLDVTVSFNIPLSIYLQYEDVNSPGTWHTYQEIHGMAYTYDSGTGTGDAWMEPNDPAWAYWTNIPNYNNSAKNAIAVGGTNNYTVDQLVYGSATSLSGVDPLTSNEDTWAVFTLDPRTVRYNIWAAHDPTTGVTTINTNNWSAMSDVLKGGAQGPHFAIGGGGADAPSWMDNVAANNKDTVAGASSYYVDRDSNRRTADAGGWANATPLTAGVQMQRPLLLARPFRSVAEIGYAFRDDPWKSLNLISANSADAGLLDIFCIGSRATGDKPAPDVVAGKLNINSAVYNSIAAGTTSNPVLQALFSQTLRDYQTASGNPTILNTSISTAANCQALATNVVNYIKINGPLVNITDLPAIFPQVPAATAPTPLYTGLNEPSEAFIRALADSSGTRTWNLMIDIIAQSGKYSPSATSLNNFTVEGEKHYWLHVAIDRFTGQIVAQQLEPVMN